MSLESNLKFLLRFLIKNQSLTKNGTVIDNEELAEATKETYETDLTLEKDNRHPEFLWLLIIDLLIFVALTLTSYSSSKKLSSRNKLQSTTAAEDFKPKFIKGLVYANGGRLLYI
jgi:hypothetical protein